MVELNPYEYWHVYENGSQQKQFIVTMYFIVGNVISEMKINVNVAGLQL